MRGVTVVALCACLSAAGSAHAAEPFTIFDAIKQAVRTHPAVGEAAANRRGTEADLRQTQGVLLPQVRLEVRAGPELSNQKSLLPAPQGNDSWLPGSSESVVVRQIVFDGFASINKIWQRAANVDAAAFRVHERSELTALDAAEAYIDVIRYTRLVKIAQENVAAHRKILANVEARFKGGRSGEGDLQTARERVAATEAALADFRQSLDSARGAYRQRVGLEPFNLRAPGRLGALPASKDDALAVTLKFNPTIQAAQADADAAKFGFHSTAGALLPNVSLEGRALTANNSDFLYGKRDQLSAKVVMTWDIFTGGQNEWARAGAAERYIEQTMKHAKLQRAAFESIDKAWAARTITNDRIASLERQVNADRKAIAAYGQEYELGQRSLIDLLNVQNQLFNGLVSLESSRGVAVFADYQLLAAMGQLLTYLKAPEPMEAEPLVNMPQGPFPIKIPPILLKLPDSGSEPLNIQGPVQHDGRSYMAPRRAVGLAARWPSEDSSNTFAGLMRRSLPAQPEAAPAVAESLDSRWPQTMSFAAPSPMLAMPFALGEAVLQK